MDKQKQVDGMVSVICGCINGGGHDYCDGCIKEKYSGCIGIAESLVNAGYRKESDIVKEVLEKVMSFAAEDEVGLKWLIRKTAKEYGVELSGKLIKMRAV